MKLEGYDLMRTVGCTRKATRAEVASAKCAPSALASIYVGWLGCRDEWELEEDGKGELAADKMYEGVLSGGAVRP